MQRAAAAEMAGVRVVVALEAAVMVAAAMVAVGMEVKEMVGVDLAADVMVVAVMAAVATEVAAMAAETRTAPSRLQTAGCDHRQCHYRSMSPRTSCRRTPDEDGRRAARRGSPARL